MEFLYKQSSAVTTGWVESTSFFWGGGEDPEQPLPTNIPKRVKELTSTKANHRLDLIILDPPTEF